MSNKWLDRFIISPCSNPDMQLDDVLDAYSSLGFHQFEVFTSWAKSAFDIDVDPAVYLNKGNQYGMTFPSFHLPPVNSDLELTLERAVRATKFAKAVGAHIVLFKADTIENFIKAGKPYLDAIEGLGITPVLQNHYGTAISTLEDFERVISGINDNRMKTLLEVGHFHSAGVSWQQGYDLLGDSIAFVHIKDQIGKQSVPFGTGEIDLAQLFEHMESVGYTGQYVVEMEVEDSENTLKYLADAILYIQQHEPKVK